MLGVSCVFVFKLNFSFLGRPHQASRGYAAGGVARDRSPHRAYVCLGAAVLLLELLLNIAQHRSMSSEEAEGWKQAALAFKKLVIKLEADVLMLQGKVQRVRVLIVLFCCFQRALNLATRRRRRTQWLAGTSTTRC